MTIFFRGRVLTGIAVALAASAGQTQAFANPSASSSEIIPLYVATARPLAMLTIGGRAPSPVVFDTGTDDNILDSAYATQVGLKVVGQSPLTDVATNRSIQVPVAAVPDARLSGVALDSKTAQLLDYSRGDEIGVFGPASFGGRYVVIEAGLNRLRLISKSSGFVPPGPGNPYKDNLPAVEVSVDGRAVEAHIDTGNDSPLILGRDLIKSVRLKSPAKVVGIARSALGDRQVLGGELSGSLRVGPYRLQSPELTFSPSGRGGNIGFAVIRHLTIVLDPENKRSWVLDPVRERPTWKDFTGRFGPRTIRFEHGKLIHQREGRPAFKLQYLGGDLFEMPATNDRIQFYRKDGRVVRLELITADGQIAPAERAS